MTRIHIISGFLGSGKTTLISYLLEGRQNRGKLAIIENEFGQVGLDGTLLQSGELPIREINSGCICCSLAQDFRQAIRQLQKAYQPEEIIIEPSGVGLLSDVQGGVHALLREDWERSVQGTGGIRSLLRSSRGFKPSTASQEETGSAQQPQNSGSTSELKLGSSITVVDAQKYEKYARNFGSFYRDQIAAAKELLVTRTEMLTDEQKQTCVEFLRNLNPRARIHFRSLHSRTPEEWNAILLDGAEPTGEELTAASRPSQHPAGAPSLGGLTGSRVRTFRMEAGSAEADQTDKLAANDVFTSRAWRIAGCTRATAEALRVALRAGAFGQVIRLKAAIPRLDRPEEWLHLEFAGGEWQRGRLEPQEQPLLIAIGTQWNPEALEAFFRAHELEYVSATVSESGSETVSESNFEPGEKIGANGAE